MTGGARQASGTGPRRAAAALALLALACSGGRAEPGTAAQRLLAAPGDVTLGSETRLASADKPRLVLRQTVAAGASLPERVDSPWTGAAPARVLLSARVWPGTGPLAPERAGAQRASAVVDREPGGLPLAALWARLPEPPFAIEVVALPVPDPPLRVTASAQVPPGGLLAFGYGLREESWEASSTPVRFRARAVGAAGEQSLLFEATLDPADTEARRWHDVRVDLADLAGRRVQLELEASWEAGEGAFALPVFADPAVYAPGSEARGERPNLILISLDTLRARSLGGYGYPRDTSPFIDVLGREGVLFDAAMAPASITAPSHMSLFTGLYPVHHGLLTGQEWKRPGVRTLASLLRGAGYRTAAFTEDGFLVRPRGFGEGFASYVENRQLPGRPRDVRVTFGQARRWLEENDRQPFFVFVHTYEVHAPYSPPAAYGQLFAGDGLAGPQRADVRGMRDAYDREIRYVDDELRSLFATLRDLGLARSTLVVITADHGEEFAEHGWLQHGSTVYEEVLHVPLLFWGPGRVPAGRHVATPVSLIDVAPTLLSLAGVATPAGLDGVDLSPLLDGSRALEPRRLFAEARSPVRQTGPHMIIRWNPPMVAVRSQDQKFIVHRPAHGRPDPTRAYDLRRDPDEQHPRVLQGAEKREVEALVDRYLAGAGAASPPGEATSDLDPDTEAQLRELGYVD